MNTATHDSDALDRFFAWLAANADDPAGDYDVRGIRLREETTRRMAIDARAEDLVIHAQQPDFEALSVVGWESVQIGSQTDGLVTE